MKKKNKSKEKFLFKLMKKFLSLFVKRPTFHLLGDFSLSENAIYLSNHSKASGPILAQLYFPVKFRFWGTYEMCMTFKERYHYLKYVFFHVGWNVKSLFICQILTLIAIGPVHYFYKNVGVIPTYTDSRLLSTFKESFNVLLKEKESIYIFPENIDEGYFDELSSIHSGYYLLAERCLKKGFDIPVYVMYYQRETNRMLIHEPLYFSQIKDKFTTKEETSESIKNILNKYAKLTTEEIMDLTKKTI